MLILCAVLQRSSRLSSSHLSVDALGLLEDAAFAAGVQSAINAHLTYMQTEMLKGNLPSRAGMGVVEWENQARMVWLNQNPSSRVSAPSAKSLFPE